MKKDKPIFISEILFTLYIAAYYILWLPCAVVKDLMTLVYIPFDVRRLYDSMAASRKNLRSAFDFFRDFKSEEPETKNEEQKTVGFNVMPTVYPTHDEISVGMGVVEEDYEDDEEDKQN